MHIHSFSSWSELVLTCLLSLNSVNYWGKLMTKTNYFFITLFFISSGCSLFLTFALSTNVYWDWSTISVLNCTFDLHISPEHPMITIYAVYSWCFYACLLGWPFYLVWVQRTQVTSLIKKEINMLLKIGWVSDTNSFINFFLTLHTKLIV